MSPDYVAILSALDARGVEFIVVGGICAVLNGATVTTLDIDVVHRRTPENVDRLLEALQDLDAHARGRKGPKLVPGRTHLMGEGHQLLITRHGPLDLLGSVGKGRTYESLLGSTFRMTLPDGLQARVLSLEALIDLKVETNREKDRAMLPALRRTLEERRRG